MHVDFVEMADIPFIYFSKTYTDVTRTAYIHSFILH